MSHPDPLFDPENSLPEDIDGFDAADMKYQEEKDAQAIAEEVMKYKSY